MAAALRRSMTSIGDIAVGIASLPAHVPAATLGGAASAAGDFAPVPELANKISAWKGDITKLQVDAIVNAANSRLLGGGGVDGAIHAAAGSRLLDACRALRGCETGDAKTTPGFALPAKYVIHTVGPVGEKPDLLASAYRRCMEEAKKVGARTVAFPCVSTGVYGYPKGNAAWIALTTVRAFMESLPAESLKNLDRVVFTLFGDDDVAIYKQLVPIVFPAK